MPNYKKYNGVQYRTDADYDYSDEIARYANAGNYAEAARLERERNAKIQGEGLGVATTNQYQKYLTQKADGDISTGTYNPTPYDTTADYSDLIDAARARGDYGEAYRLEQQRNSKIDNEGLSIAKTNEFERYNPATRYTYDPSKNTEYQKASKDAQARYNAIPTGGYDPAKDSEYQKRLSEAQAKYGSIPSGYDPESDARYQAYSQQMNDLYQKIMNGGKFEYNVLEDPLYQQYRDQYMAQGRQAMRDTIGQAAALTGGYSNTYAQTAGDQAYGRYLERLNDVVPELYSAAYGRYRDEQNALLQQYQMAAGLADTAYNRGYQLARDARSDALADYQIAQGMADTAYERGYAKARDDRSDAMQEYQIAQELADQAYERDYQRWSTQLGLEREDEAAKRSQYYADQERDYEREQNAYAQQQAELQNNRSFIVSLIAAGYTPSAADLAAAGLTQEQADALRQQYLMSFNSGGTGGGSSGRRSSGGSRRSSGSGSSAGGTPTVRAPAASEFSDTEMPSAQYSGLQRQIVAYINKGDADTALQLVAKNKGSMTEEQYNAIIRLLKQME